MGAGRRPGLCAPGTTRQVVLAGSYGWTGSEVDRDDECVASLLRWFAFKSWHRTVFLRMEKGGKWRDAMNLLFFFCSACVHCLLL